MYRPQTNEKTTEKLAFGVPEWRQQGTQNEGHSHWPQQQTSNWGDNGREIMVKQLETVGTLGKEFTGSRLVGTTVFEKNSLPDEFTKAESQPQPRPASDKNTARQTADVIVLEPQSRDDLPSSGVTESALLASQLAAQKLKLRQASYFRCSSAPIMASDVVRREESMCKPGPIYAQEDERSNLVAKDRRSVTKVSKHRSIEEVGAVLERRPREVAHHNGDAYQQSSQSVQATIPLSRQLQMQRNRLTKPKLTRSASVPLDDSTRRSVRELIKFLEGKLHFGSPQTQIPSAAAPKSTLPHQNEGCKPLKTELSLSSPRNCVFSSRGDNVLPFIGAEQHISSGQALHNSDLRHDIDEYSGHSVQSPHDVAKAQEPSIVTNQLKPSILKNTTLRTDSPSTATSMSNQPPVDIIRVIDNSPTMIVESACENQSNHYSGTPGPSVKSPVDPDHGRKDNKDTLVNSKSGCRKTCSFLNYNPPKSRRENLCVFLGYKPPNKQVECMVPNSVSILARSRRPNTEDLRIGQTTHISCRLSLNLTKEVDRLSCIVESLDHKTRPYRHVSSAFDPLDIAITKVLIEESPLTIRLLPRGTTGRNRRNTQNKRSPPIVSLFSGT